MTYRGSIEDGRHAIWTSDAVKLLPRTDLYEYSNVFSWGELNGGTYQAAVSLMADLFQSCASCTALAKSLHVDFAKDVIAKLEAEWEMTDREVREWMWEKFIECPTWFKNKIIRVLRDDAQNRWISAKPGAPAPSEDWVREEIKKHLVVGIGIHEDKVAGAMDFLMK
jgi:hypothetical protein